MEVTLSTAPRPTSADRARAMMHKFNIELAHLIYNVGPRAIIIALRPQHFVGGVLGMNRCHGRRHRATNGGQESGSLTLPIIVVPAELTEPPTGCCSAVVALQMHRETYAQGRSRRKSSIRRSRPFSTFNPLLPWTIRHSEIVARPQPILALSSI
ncbi:hypothetical protein THAOC_27526 [Thalassiosira oceanica]|uniref:DUF6820 domain-containing protein n=1 Tax=Thalassiosira oceanica TaxID=159749 RepID=K0RHB2_THAOC|nr:hypothetical protein THAOC_27526 [Thalassiosira oceanica]|eukprot:EJK53103.1 hypothetical protein THAOC_27526 [Thalassiosira oceanica]